MFSSLNAPQLEAVNQTEGAILVLAGAGTGKTKVLTSRIINIVNLGLANPMQILAVTFTNKAAAEMRHRISDVIGDSVHNLWIGTFHSIASKILRRHAEIVGLKSDFTIIDQDDQLRLIKQILADLNIDTKQFPAKNYLNKISHNKDVKGGDKSFLSDSDTALPKLRSLYDIYQNRLKMMNATDFGDLLSYNLEIFAKSPETLAFYQDKFRYILVDEYQDTNNVQYSWLLQLANKRKNICAVGDDDQSIYSWRGANIANILRFEKDFNDAKVIRLEQNYRSSSQILRASDSVIKNNKERHGKTLWTDKKGGEQVKLYSFVDDRGEARQVTSTIEKYIRQKKYRPKEIAILVRAGYQTRAFEEALIKASIPYKIVGGMKFYERAEIKDAICYLRAASNFNDDLALGRIINVPKRGVGKTSIDMLYQKSKQRDLPLFSAIDEALVSGELKGKTKDSLKLLLHKLQIWNSLLEKTSLSDLARQILEESGYIQMWQAENSLEAQGRLENIDEFISSLADFENMTEFLEYVSLVEAKDDKNAAETVSVMTVHGAKGLEFDLVFVPGLEDGVFPSSRSLDEREGEEEERRLLYVAITRAKKELILCYAKQRFVFGDYQQSMPSRFLKELPEEIKLEEFGYDEFVGGYESGYGAVRGGGFGGVSASKMPAKGGFSRFQGGFKKDGVVHGNFGSNNEIRQSKTQIAAKKEYDKSDDFFGKRVFHQKFGYGKVIAVDGSKVEVAFEKTGKKTLMKDFLSLA
jgi:DNA helicase-2/ATP-dependent DNA helicase PcrA